jgi:hypothetical protein
MAGKKTFVAGEVLTAQDVNDYLMDQSVMNFATSAARASAIPTPTEGMTSYISTTGTASIPQIETYTGSAWQTPYGQTLVANVSFTSATLVTIDNVFTADYQDYEIYLDLDTSSITDNCNIKLRVGGTTPALTAYQAHYIFQNEGSGTVTGSFVSNSSAFTDIHRTTSGSSSFAKITISKPQETKVTQIFAAIKDNVVYRTYGARLNNTVSYDGFAFALNTAAANSTGSIRVYGLRKA